MCRFVTSACTCCNTAREGMDQTSKQCPPPSTGMRLTYSNVPPFVHLAIFPSSSTVSCSFGDEIDLCCLRYLIQNLVPLCAVLKQWSWALPAWLTRQVEHLTTGYSHTGLHSDAVPPLQANTVSKFMMFIDTVQVSFILPCSFCVIQSRQ